MPSMFTFGYPKAADTIYSGAAWRDFNFATVALGRGNSAPGLVQIASTGIYAPGFDGVNNLEQLFGYVELDHDWVEGSIIKPHVHWMPSTDGSGNVKWYMAYTLAEDGEVEPAVTTLSVVQSTNGVAWENFRADFPDIDATGIVIGTQFAFRFYRDSDDDTYGADAVTKTIGLHVQVNSFGSRQVNVK